MLTSSVVVVDCSIAVYVVLEYPLSSQVEALWKSWIEADVKIIAPRLWLNEVTSAIHKVYMLKRISEESALDALNAILSLGVELFDVDNGLCLNAFAWATRLEKLPAYDSFYLALAEQSNAAF